MNYSETYYSKNGNIPENKKKLIRETLLSYSC